MQIQINLDKLFGDPDATKQENSQPSCNTSINADTYHQQQSFDFHYKLKTSIFDNDDESCTSVQPQQPSIKAKQKSNSRDNNSISSEISGGYTIPENTLPGERLYYQSKNNMIRKRQQIERIKQESLARQDYENTFKPQINKRSQKLAKNLKKGSQMFSKAGKKCKQMDSVPSFMRKQEEQIQKQCTFKPQLVAKSSCNLHRTKQQVFDGLFNEHKIKQIKHKLKTEEEQPPTPKPKKLTKKQLQNFLSRNNQFLNKVQKKNQLLIRTSNKFDLETGHKLFTPTTHSTNTHTKRNKHNNPVSGFMSPKSSGVGRPIFGKNSVGEVKQVFGEQAIEQYPVQQIQSMFPENSMMPNIFGKKYLQQNEHKRGQQQQIHQVPQHQQQQHQHYQLIEDSPQQISQIAKKEQHDEPSLTSFQKPNKPQLQDNQFIAGSNNVLIFQISDVHQEQAN